MSWETLKVTRRRGDYGPYVVMPDRMTYHCPEAVLLQRNEIGQTRVVLGFRVGVRIVPADEIEGWTGLLANDVLIRSRLGEARFESVPSGLHTA